jgi:Cellulase (glycosyl hydrolase family 5)
LTDSTDQFWPFGDEAPEPRRSRRRFWLILVAMVMAILLAGFILVRSSGADPPAVQPPGTGLYHWPAGIMPVGVTVSTLQDYEMTPAVVHYAEREAWNTRYPWHGNTIRYQITQDRLVGTGGHRLNRAYLADIRQVTDYSLKIGLTVVLNAQTEMSVGYPTDEGWPDNATTAFWLALARYYAGNSHVIFDLFNEPRRVSWDQWRASFQHLIDVLRSRGITNQLWVECHNWGDSCVGMPLLSGRGIVYSFHHPGSPWPYQTPVNQATWDASFGYLAREGLPVVDGEFSNYQGSYDWAYPEVPGMKPGPEVVRYLDYLASLHIGMLAWSMLPGSLTNGTDLSSVTREPQGDGLLIRNWLVRHNLTWTPCNCFAHGHRHHRRHR